MIRWIAVLALVLSSAAEVSAGMLSPSAYESFSQSPFFGGSYDYFYLEDFEDGALNTPGVSMNYTFGLGSTGVTGNDPITGEPLTGHDRDPIDSVDLDDGTADHNGNDGRSLFLGGPTFASSVLTFDFSPIGGLLPTSAGIVWTDSGRTNDPHSLHDDPSGLYGHSTVFFEAFDNLGVSLGVIGPTSLGDGKTNGGTREDTFFGVTNAAGISRIRLSINSADWEVDHLQYGAAAELAPPSETPAPPSQLLAIIGAVGGLGIVRRRRTAAA